VFALFFFTQTIAAGEQLDDDAEETEFWQQIEVHQKDAARLTSLEEARTLADCSSTAMLSTISQVRILSLFQQAFYRKIG
jgi:hypothetical protein